MGFEQNHRSDLVLYIERDTVNMVHFLILKNTLIPLHPYILGWKIYGPCSQCSFSCIKRGLSIGFAQNPFSVPTLAHFRFQNPPYTIENRNFDFLMMKFIYKWSIFTCIIFYIFLGNPKFALVFAQKNFLTKFFKLPVSAR